MYMPHLLKEVPAIGELPAVGFTPLDPSRPNPKVLPIPEDIHHKVVEGMWSVVNGGGTGARIAMAGFDIAGKTGTAQVVGLGKDVGKNKDHSWFVSYAPAYKPEIAMVALIENSGFGGSHAAPAVRGVYDVYYRKTRHEEPPGAVQQIAKAQTPQSTATETAGTPATTAPKRSTVKPAPAKPAGPKPVAKKRATPATQQAVVSNQQ
jgi:penicillin-binding protein 2